jgi:hypothetical protein
VLDLVEDVFAFVALLGGVLEGVNCIGVVEGV